MLSRFLRLSAPVVLASLAVAGHAASPGETAAVPKADEKLVAHVLNRAGF